MILNSNTGEDAQEGEVAFSVVSKNKEDFVVIAYPANREEEVLLYPTREGWTFSRWLDETGTEMTAENLINGRKYFAEWIDKVPPEMELLCTKNTDKEQTITIKANDIASEIGGYYAGMENPDEVETEYTETTAEDFEVKITQPGVYYFGVKDSCGNNAVQSCRFLQVFLVPGEEETCDCQAVLGREGDVLALPEAKKRGHDFVGWLSPETGTEPIKEYHFSREVQFTPMFVPSKYKIVLDADGGTCEQAELTATFGETYPVLPEAQRTGYHFLGWASEKDGEILKEGTIYEIDDDSTLYARWKPVAYTVRYNSNGGEQGEMEDISCTYDTAFRHPRNAFTRTGYVFKGWSLSPDTISTQNALSTRDRSYNGAEWLNEDEALNLSSEADSVVNLYAVWQKIEVGVMDYRYCMGNYMYFACTTLSYKTENMENNGALFVGITPAGGAGVQYGTNAIWASSMIREALNDVTRNDMTGLKMTNTTVNYSYSGNMWEYDPTKQSPCTLADRGYGPRLSNSGINNKVATTDYFFIPDMRDCFYYYAGNAWNWFWDINLDGIVDTTALYGMSQLGPDDSYYTLINAIRQKWAQMGWPGRYWLRNQYTGYGNYPFYISEYGVSSCNPEVGQFKDDYANLAITGRYLIRPMYTMEP